MGALRVDEALLMAWVKAGRITGVSIDSRRVRPGDLFVAIPGRRTDGHAYIEKAVAQGAVAVLGERDPAEMRLPQDVPYARVSSARRAASLWSARVYGHPSRELTVVGITGTNGKTTSVYWLAHVLQRAGLRTGLASSVAIDTVAERSTSSLTTPEAPDLHRALRQMVEHGATHAVMEVSSHAIVQERTADVDFDLALLTNITREHLDFHGTMANYVAAKARLFHAIAPDKPGAVLNADCPYAPVIASGCRARVFTYGLAKGDLLGEVVEQAGWCTRFRMRAVGGRWYEVVLNHPGVYQVYNALGVAASAYLLGVPLDAIADAVPSLPAVPGRMHLIRTPGAPDVVIDYAHTPDALAQVLRTVRRLCDGEVWLVFGGRGERDRGKRPMMGEVAARWAHHIIVTSDSPYGEDAGAIAEEICAGARRVPGAHVAVELDRAKAIAAAICTASSRDLVLITGRGHEAFQVFGERRVERSDEAMVRDAIALRGGATSF
ncbi:UDP-N-acetylmuramoyl-L-alanyl-D-glutamate--2,6-diaminopimelate ligase [Alicyclobacillus sendaiensis]|uniref:UDP-N-acetylmuramyl-tripeptide synthetase n=1 Tax=Alicyclobacillus sendaiensis PA2 TaxID=3029425 RepID=A0ABT6Y1H1_ALISE|nr:UDP-N-acetylmuramoyl-L-alanyl-D-glutamate--2,6-diaminopimelate ligase [Alicyclobacillus sendaiensis]MDI9261204.1 UDP-N-acetylmuramoyl-L-alanyl-D-glutamate--2,6-diaminopimelate ligase [Alicyclobacillus sendaiensis PA2]